MGDARARRPRGARRSAPLPAARARAAGARRRCGRSRRISTAGTGRSSSTGSAAGSSAWSPGSIAWRAGSASSSARSRPGRTISRASSRKGAALLGVAVARPSRRGSPPRSATAPSRSSRSETLEIVVDSERATFGSWYELFPRSWGGFAGVEKRLPEFAELGFDVLYLPPVHPIGLTHRKGRNNATTARRCDPGSPWAIGSEPAATRRCTPTWAARADFARLTKRAAELGIAIALDFAIQCSPDHPWLREHPDWFHRRPDGTLKYAENPPKRYQDIYNVNFDTRRLARALERAARRRPALGVAGRERLSRRQPAHQADRVLGVADRRGAGAAPRDGVPRRGLHAAGDDGAARQGRLQPVLHVLHVAQHEGRADVVHDRADALGAAAVLPARTSSPTRPTSSTPTSSEGGPPGVRGAARAGRDALAHLRPLLRLRALRERAAQRGQRGVPQLREVRAQEAQPARAAALADRPPQRRAPRQSGAAGARQPDVPRDRERAPDRLPQAQRATTS